MINKDSDSSELPLILEDKTAVFMPYTAFHIASLLRILNAGVWVPNGSLVVVVGLGTVGTNPSGKYYLQLLKLFLAKYQALKVNFVSSVVGLIKVVREARNDSILLITGNLRRIQSLAVARLSANIILVDDGVGTSRSGGYFDPKTNETRTIKKILIRGGVLPTYESQLLKIHAHFTVYDRSIFPNPRHVEFVGVTPQKDLMKLPIVSKIFVTSFLRDKKIDHFIKWVNENFTDISEYAVSVHPNMPSSSTRKLINGLNIDILNLGPVLLEEYIYYLISIGLFVSIRGQINSSVEIIKQNNLCDVECLNYARSIQF